MSFVQEFKEFAMKGNVVDLAVGVIIGGAFQKIVDSLVKDLLMPIIGKLLGGVDFKHLYLNLGDKTFETMEAAEKGGRSVVQVRCLRQLDDRFHHRRDGHLRGYQGHEQAQA
jgi:large conductance mechanosensitive channel